MTGSPDTAYDGPQVAPTVPSDGAVGASASVEGTPFEGNVVEGNIVEGNTVEGTPIEGTAVAAGPAFSWRKLAWAATPLLVLGGLIFIEFPLCPSRNLFGIPCPGCGLTRATEALVVGDFASMLRLHPFAPILTPLVLFGIVRVTLVSGGVIRRAKDPLARIPRWAWGTFAGLLLGFWGARIFGFFGGLPDPLDPTRGLLYRGLHGAWLLVTGQLGPL